MTTPKVHMIAFSFLPITLSHSSFAPPSAMFQLEKQNKKHLMRHNINKENENPSKCRFKFNSLENDLYLSGSWVCNWNQLLISVHVHRNASFSVNRKISGKSRSTSYECKLSLDFVEATVDAYKFKLQITIVSS